MLIDAIESAQNGNQDDMLYLIQRFSPVIKKYGRKLFEDGVEELTLDFLELIHNFNQSKMNFYGDGAIVNYLSKCLYHCFLSRIKAATMKRTVNYDDLPEVQQKAITELTTIDNDPLEWSLPQKCLTNKELEIIRGIYEYGYSSAELAKIMGVSRQNINQIKKYAESKIKESWQI